MTDFFTADTHAYHLNIIKYCDRPFTTVEEMNSTMIERWNSVVKPEDTVYHLGDVVFGPGSLEHLEEFVTSLNGHKVLITGNHDRQTVQWYKDHGFEYVYTGEFWKYKNSHILLSHRPYPIKHPYINIHGHTHNLLHTQESCYKCVSVEQTDYYPVTLGQLGIKQP